MEGWVLVAHPSRLGVRPWESAECNNLRVPFSLAVPTLRMFFSLRTLAAAGRLLPFLSASLATEGAAVNQQDWPLALVFGDSCLPTVFLQAPGKGLSPLRTSQNIFSISLLMFGIAFLWTKPSIPQ